jgi:hypothetical protein
MRTIALCVAALIGIPGATPAQPAVDIRVTLPTVLPRLVVVSPGVQVVPEVQEEVFFHDGWYWVRRDDYWYRSRSHRGGWMLVPSRRVPPRLVALPPPGHYRYWKAEKEHEKAERKAEKRREKAERRAEREERYEDRHDHGHGHGNGHGHD